MLRANLKSVLVSFIALLGACLWPAKAAAVDTCNGNFVNPIGDICWDCMFPLSIGPLLVNRATCQPDHLSTRLVTRY